MADVRPVCRPEWIVGTCPRCGGPVVENDYYRQEVGHWRLRQCWNGMRLAPAPKCGYWLRMDSNPLVAGSGESFFA